MCGAGMKVETKVQNFTVKIIVKKASWDCLDVSAGHFVRMDLIKDLLLQNSVGKRNAGRLKLRRRKVWMVVATG